MGPFPWERRVALGLLSGYPPTHCTHGRVQLGAGMSNSVVSWLLALGNHSQRLEAASAAGEHVSRLGLDPVWEIVPSAVRSKSESASWGMTPYFTSQV